MAIAASTTADRTRRIGENMGIPFDDGPASFVEIEKNAPRANSQLISALGQAQGAHAPSRGRSSIPYSFASEYRTIFLSLRVIK